MVVVPFEIRGEQEGEDRRGKKTEWKTPVKSPMSKIVVALRLRLRLRLEDEDSDSEAEVVVRGEDEPRTPPILRFSLSSNGGYEEYSLR